LSRVLIIDPDADAREILQVLLSHAGYEVDVAPEPAAGIALAIQNRPAAIVSELFVRTEEGWALLEYLRSTPLTASIPVVVHSCYSMPDDRARAFRSGAVRFLAKPAEAAEIVDALEQLRVASLT